MSAKLYYFFIYCFFTYLKEPLRNLFIECLKRKIARRELFAEYQEKIGKTNKRFIPLIVVCGN
jgi:hypothetical protein